MTLDRPHARQAFAEYTSHYNAADPKVKLKIDHTYRVAALCERIANSLSLPPQDVDLAWLCGLLHDVGRFEQLRRYGTFIDAKSIDHALMSVTVLFEEGRLRDYIAGTDEETGFRDIKWYYGSHPYAPHTLSPDADFPIINLEKGHYQPTFQAAWPQAAALPRVAAFSGGTRLNMVPPKAQATVLGLSPRQVEEAFQALALEGAVTCTCTQEGEALHVACAGQNAHGSTPEEGHNAQTALVALLAALPLADCPSTRAIRALHALFPHGDHRGTALGIAQADDLSGPLTLAFTMLTLNDTGCTGRFDSRTPLTATQASVQTVAEAALRAAGFVVQGDMDPPHYVPESDPFLRTLAQCYEAYTGQKGQCLAIGGGTYVHDIPGGVAFGPNMPGFVSNLHGPDEKIRVADLLTTAKIYAQVMVALCL